jgi:hypothetical protein
MDLIQEINDIYNTRSPIEQSCLEILVNAFDLIDTDLLQTGKNHSFIQNDWILTISLQHKHDNDRLILFLFQNGFIEIQFDCYVEVYQYSDLLNNREIRDEFLNLVLKILDSSFKHIEYYFDNQLVKYTSIWDNDFLKEKTIFIKPFGRIIEKFKMNRQYVEKEIRAKSFLRNEL